MKYCIKIIGSAAYVIRKAFVHSILDVATPRVGLYSREAQIITPTLQDLSSVMSRLPFRFPELSSDTNRDGPNDKNPATRFMLDECELRIVTLPRSFIQRQLESGVRR
jgi:hypothetical protein